MKNIVELLQSKLMHTTEHNKSLVEDIVGRVKKHKDLFKFNIINESEENELVFLDIIYESITKGIVGKLNIEEILRNFNNSDNIIYQLPSEDNPIGYVKIEITSQIEDTDDTLFLESLKRAVINIIEMDESGEALYDSKALRNFEVWCDNLLTSETGNIMYKFRLFGDGEDKTIRSYKLSGRVYNSIYSWLNSYADMEGFSIDYDEEALTEFILNLKSELNEY